MKITFLGTRGYINARSKIHYWHTSTLRTIFTHCGTQLVTSDSKIIEKKIKEIGALAGVKASIAHDGMSLILG